MGDRRTDNLPRFKDQVALVVGAAHGIGKAIAVRLGREGADVVIADVDPEAMETTVKEMRCEGSRCQGLICDVREHAQVEAAEVHVDVGCAVAGTACQSMVTDECGCTVYVGQGSSSSTIASR